MVLLGQSPGHDAHHAGMPAVVGQDQRGVVLGIERGLDLLGGGQVHAPLQRLPRGVQPVHVSGQLLGPVGRSVVRSSTASRAWPSRPAAFSRGARENAMSSASNCGLSSSPATFKQGGQSDAGLLLQARQPMAHQHAILVHQRHHVGHRAQGGQPHGLDQEGPHRGGDFARPAGLLAQGPGQLQRHAGPTQVRERILAPGQPRMDDRRCLREAPAPARGGR